MKVSPLVIFLFLGLGVIAAVVSWLTYPHVATYGLADSANVAIIFGSLTAIYSLVITVIVIHRNSKLEILNTLHKLDDRWQIIAEMAEENKNNYYVVNFLNCETKIDVNRDRLWRRLLSLYLLAFRYHRYRILSQREWLSYHSALKTLCNEPGFNDYWEQRSKYWHNVAFKEEIKRCMTHQNK